MEHSDLAGTVTDYLRVDDFISDMVTARALTTAFELRLIDALAAGRPATYEALKQVVPSTEQGLKLLLNLLVNGGVLEACAGGYALTIKFNAALRYRDLLLAKLDFAHIAAHDFIDSFSHLTADPLQFMQRSGMFRLFNYANALEYTPEHRRQAERWMRITTLLTRHESAACFSRHGLGKYRRMLDVGGNSGEFALQACRVAPELQATVYDLPLVCDVGADYLKTQPGSDRIVFRKGNARDGEFPGGFDLITFKSMLHDWPEAEARRFIEKACSALEVGGTLLIFERGPFDAGTKLSYANIPILLFAHTLRAPSLYQECLEALGFQSVEVQWINLDMPFILVTGIKPEPF